MNSWSHEQEWRAIYMEKGRSEYVELGGHNPTAVILGHRCTPEHAAEIREACNGRSIPVYETYVSASTYSVRIVPCGFRPEYSDTPLYDQVKDECERRGIPMFGVW